MVRVGEVRTMTIVQKLFMTYAMTSMTILNTGEVTRISSSGTQESSLDLSLVSNQSSLDCTWKVIKDPYGSDHLPIILSIESNHSISTPIDIPYDVTRNIDRKKYAKKINENIQAVPNFHRKRKIGFSCG